MAKKKQRAINRAEAEKIAEGLWKIDTVHTILDVRALKDLSLIAEGFSDVTYALGAEGFGMTDDDWRNFSLTTSRVLELARERADEQLAELKQVFDNIQNGVREMQSTSSICAAIGLASTIAIRRRYGRQ